MLASSGIRQLKSCHRNLQRKEKWKGPIVHGALRSQVTDLEDALIHTFLREPVFVLHE